MRCIDHQHIHLAPDQFLRALQEVSRRPDSGAGAQAALIILGGIAIFINQGIPFIKSIPSLLQDIGNDIQTGDLPDWMKSTFQSIGDAVSSAFQNFDAGAFFLGFLQGVLGLVGFLCSLLVVPFFVFYAVRDQPKIAEGFYVVDLIGMGVNQVTGDYSRGAGGFWIKNGELTFPVSEVTIAGHLNEMFSTLTPANDLEFRYGTNSPTVRIEGLTIAGQ